MKHYKISYMIMIYQISNKLIIYLVSSVMKVNDSSKCNISELNNDEYPTNLDSVEIVCEYDSSDSINKWVSNSYIQSSSVNTFSKSQDDTRDDSEASKVIPSKKKNNLKNSIKTSLLRAFLRAVDCESYEDLKNQVRLFWEDVKVHQPPLLQIRDRTLKIDESSINIYDDEFEDEDFIDSIVCCLCKIQGNRFDFR